MTSFYDTDEVTYLIIRQNFGNWLVTASSYETAAAQFRVDCPNDPPLRAVFREARATFAQTDSVVCISGSIRFFADMVAAASVEEAAGHIALLPFPVDIPAVGEPVREELLRTLRERHHRKIDLAGEVLVVNPGGTIGESTRDEIDHAEATGKPVRYLVPPVGDQR